MKIDRPESKQPIPPTAKKVFEGVIFDVYQWEQEMFDGTKATFEKLKRPDTVIIYPVLPNGKILMINEQQPGAAPSVGVPGGRVDQGEDILSAAKRELMEETGYTAEEYILWNAKQPLGKIEWATYTFVAKGLKKVSDPSFDPGEKIEMLEVTFEDFSDMATSGRRGFEEDVEIKLLNAKLDPDKMKEIRVLFKPI